MSHFEKIKEAITLPTQLMPLAAIWLNDAVTVETDTFSPRKTRRITPDMRVRIDNNRLVDISEANPATHQVTGVFGDIQSINLELTAINLNTQELITLKM